MNFIISTILFKSSYLFVMKGSYIQYQYRHTDYIRDTLGYYVSGVTEICYGQGALYREAYLTHNHRRYNLLILSN